MATHTARFVRWLVNHIPEPILASPERVLINFACILIGSAALLGARPGSLLALWPWWISYEWALAMLIGGGCALVGFWREKRPLARLGYMLIGFSALVYGVGVIVVFGWQGAVPGMTFLGIAVAKAVRLLVGSAIRNEVLEAGRDRGRP